MRGRQRRLLQPVLDLLADAGVKPEIEHTGGGHIRISWPGGLYFLHTTGSDRRAMRNTLTGIRRQLRSGTQ